MTIFEDDLFRFQKLNNHYSNSLLVLCNASYTYSIQISRYGVEAIKNWLTESNDWHFKLRLNSSRGGVNGKMFCFNVLELERGWIHETPAVFSEQMVESDLRIFVRSKVVRVVLI